MRHDVTINAYNTPPMPLMQPGARPAPAHLAGRAGEHTLEPEPDRIDLGIENARIDPAIGIFEQEIPIPDDT